MKRLFTLIVVALVATTNICSAQGGLNEIRFRDWEDKDWLDNDYYRELRSYIDACATDEHYDPTLSTHKEILSSKFVIVNAEPAIWGGIFVFFTFIEAPRKVFYAQVYSFVDEDKEEVVGYEVRGVTLDQEEIDLTREEIEQFIANNPEHRLW